MPGPSCRACAVMAQCCLTHWWAAGFVKVRVEEVLMAAWPVHATAAARYDGTGNSALVD